MRSEVYKSSDKDIDRFREFLVERLGRERYEVWFGGVRFELRSFVLTVFAPDQFTLDRLRNRFRVALDGYKAAVEAEITQAFDPPLYDKSKERVAKSHYFQKDFKSFKIGTLRLEKGKGLLRLTAPKIVGTGAICEFFANGAFQNDGPGS